MAWNKPNAASQPVKKSGYPPAKQPEGAARRGAKAPSKVKGIVAGLVTVCALGGLCLWMFSGGDAAPKAKAEKERGMIKEVQPAPAPTNAVAAAPAPTDKSKLSPAWQKYYDGRDTNKWRVVYNPVTKKEYISRKVTYGSQNQKPPLYDNHSLNVLDAVAFSPIASPMANVHANEQFMKSLEKALVDKIVIPDDDPEEIKARKKAMIELLADLRARLKAGEDIQKLINDSIADRNSVAQFRREVQKERARMEREGSSDEDIRAFEEIANRKLTEKGAMSLINRHDGLERMRAAKAEWEQRKAKGETK